MSQKAGAHRIRDRDRSQRALKGTTNKKAVPDVRSTSIHMYVMIVCMRTTISLDDRILEAVKRRAVDEDLSVSAWVAGVLDEAVKR